MPPNIGPQPHPAKHSEDQFFKAFFNSSGGKITAGKDMGPDMQS